MSQMTVTLIASRKVRRVEVQGKTFALPADTTDLNAAERASAVTGVREYTSGYVGPKDDSTMIVEPLVDHDHRAPFREVLEAAQKKLEARMKRAEKRLALVAQFNRIADAATSGPGQTPHTAKWLTSLRKRIEKLGGF